MSLEDSTEPCSFCRATGEYCKLCYNDRSLCTCNPPCRTIIRCDVCDGSGMALQSVDLAYDILEDLDDEYPLE